MSINNITLLVSSINRNSDDYVSNGILNAELSEVSRLFQQLPKDQQQLLGEIKISIHSSRGHTVNISGQKFPGILSFGGRENYRTEIVDCDLLALNFHDSSPEVAIDNSSLKSQLSFSGNGSLMLVAKNLNVGQVVFSGSNFREIHFNQCRCEKLVFRQTDISPFFLKNVLDIAVTEEILCESTTSSILTEIDLYKFSSDLSDIKFLARNHTAHNSLLFTSKCLKEISFTLKDSKFNKDIIFQDVSSLKTLNFENCEVHGMFLLKDSKVLRKKGDVGNGLLLARCPRIGSLEIVNVDFDDDVQIEESVIVRNIKLLNVSGNCSIFFESNVTIGKGTKNAQFYVESSNLRNLRFLGVEVFCSLEIFNSTLQTLSFELAKIHMDVRLHSNSNSCFVDSFDARDSVFSSNLNVNKSNFRRCNIVGCELSGYFRFQEVEFYEPPHIHGSNIKTYLGFTDVKTPLPPANTHLYLEDFRSLKQIMKNQGNDKYELNFSALELDCRLAEYSLIEEKSFDQYFEVFVLECYELLNRKGRSIFRPLLILFIQVCLCAVVFSFFSEVEKSKLEVIEVAKAPFWIAQWAAEPGVLALIKSIQNSAGAIGLIFDATIDYTSPSKLLTTCFRVISFFQIVTSTLLIYLTLAGIKKHLRTT